MAEDRRQRAAVGTSYGERGTQDRMRDTQYARRDTRGGSPGSRRADTRQSPGGRGQTQCRFCRRGEKYVDYKDVETLAKLLTHRGKIYSRKRSGNCAGCQRKVKKAIKRARFMAFLPFCS